VPNKGSDMDLRPLSISEKKEKEEFLRGCNSFVTLILIVIIAIVAIGYFFGHGWSLLSSALAVLLFVAWIDSP
jgi:hypothetical protein